MTSLSSDSAGEGCFIDKDKVLEGKNGCSNQTKFTWPHMFTNLESRKQSEKVDPNSVATLGKKSTKPLFGQVLTDRHHPKQNNVENCYWNFHFVLSKDGEQVQCWVFRLEKQVKAFSDGIMQDQ